MSTHKIFYPQTTLDQSWINEQIARFLDEDRAQEDITTGGVIQWKRDVTGHMEAAQDLVFVGNQGTGKTHLLTALGYVACQKGISVRFTRAIDMVNELTTAQINGTLGKALKVYTNPSLLLLDELGYLPIDKTGADLLFQVISQRYEHGSIILTTNKIYKKWAEIFNNDSTFTSAVLDRLLHHAETVRIEGKSYRMKDRIEA